MTGPCCRRSDASSPGLTPQRRRASRWLDAVGWVVPATALALMPKCPMCVIAYMALFTGIGMSLTTATAVRTALIVLCVAWIAILAARTAARVVVR